MRRLALRFALGMIVLVVILPSAAVAWTRAGHGVVVVSRGAVVVVPHSPVVVVNPVPRTVIVAPSRTVIVPGAIPFVTVRPFSHCGRWWWDGWRWVWVRTWC